MWAVTSAPSWWLKDRTHRVSALPGAILLSVVELVRISTSYKILTSCSDWAVMLYRCQWVLRSHLIPTPQLQLSVSQQETFSAAHNMFTCRQQLQSLPCSTFSFSQYVPRHYVESGVFVWFGAPPRTVQHHCRKHKPQVCHRVGGANYKENSAHHSHLENFETTCLEVNMCVTLWLRPLTEVTQCRNMSPGVWGRRHCSPCHETLYHQRECDAVILRLKKAA